MNHSGDIPSAGFDPSKWEQTCELFQRWCEADNLPAAAIIAGNRVATTRPVFFGRQNLADDSPPLREDALFLIASITKPVVCMGALLLVERGQFRLGDRVRDLVPEFGTARKHGTTVRHLLTHTSGLPDMLPNDRELRTRHAPFSDFVAGACAVEPGFPSGRGVQYQSMGIAVLAEIIQRVSQQTCRDFLRENIFEPLGMTDTSLGSPDEWYEGSPSNIERMSEIRTPPSQSSNSDWNWNSRYWRSFGAPWGGLISSPRDLATFAQVMLNEGRHHSTQIFSPATIGAATRNQLDTMPEIPEVERRARPWGLGWRLNWNGDRACFCDFLGPNAYGHWGATGTALWVDPQQDAFGVILTTQPQEPYGRYLTMGANSMMAAKIG